MSTLDEIAAMGQAEAERLLEQRRSETGRYFTEDKEQQLRALTAERESAAPRRKAS